MIRSILSQSIHKTALGTAVTASGKESDAVTWKNSSIAGNFQLGGQNLVPQCFRQRFPVQDLKLRTIYQLNTNHAGALRCKTDQPVPHTALGDAQMCMLVFHYMLRLPECPFSVLECGGIWTSPHTGLMVPLHVLRLRLEIQAVLNPTRYLTECWKPRHAEYCSLRIGWLIVRYAGCLK